MCRAAEESLKDGYTQNTLSAVRKIINTVQKIVPAADSD